MSAGAERSDLCAERKATRRRWWFFLGLMVLFLGLIVGVYQWQQAQTREAAQRSWADCRKLGDAYTDGHGLTLQFIPAGSFVMGSPADEKDREANEVQHQVTLRQPFLMGRTEVTQAQWARVMGRVRPDFPKTWEELKKLNWPAIKALVMGVGPSEFQGPDLPVEWVSWEECQEYCRRLTEQERAMGCLPDGWAYRLPTEAEWEYCCRAGNTAARYGELEAIAWHRGNAGATTHPVAGKVPNAWGLYDMIGNVGEWCDDCYGDYPTDAVVDPQGPAAGPFRVFRGGRWSSDAWRCRAAFRDRLEPDFRYAYLGLRVVLAPPVQAGTR